jgi:hypothetical protein
MELINMTAKNVSPLDTWPAPGPCDIYCLYACPPGCLPGIVPPVPGLLESVALISYAPGFALAYYG